MTAILLIGVQRPGLASALGSRGLGLQGLGQGPLLAALVSADCAPPPLPAIIEAASAEQAVALLDRGVADAVLASDPDALVAARLAALVRRAHRRLVVGDLSIDTLDRQVSGPRGAIALLPREYALLLLLARHAGETVSRGALRSIVWGTALDPGTNVIEVHVSRLRARLRAGGTAATLVTERGRGYRLVPAPIAPLGLAQ